MKICGIICEFNPLHNGHEYLIKQAKDQGYKVLCLMSGNFSQRGIPCVLDKYTRAKLAIKAGASIVIELPFIYAVNSADQFAEGAIKLLKSLNVSTIMFGSESGDKKSLENLANFKLNETKLFKEKLANYLKQGENYNEAYISAMSDTASDKTYENLALSPNDILASSYIKEIKKQKANIDYIVIKRTDNGYNSNIPIHEYLSASSIIKLKQENKSYDAFVPPYTKAELNNTTDFNYSKLMGILQNTIINTSEKDLSKIFGYTEGLEYFVKKQIQSSTIYSQFLDNMQTKRYRKARLQKLLLYTALGLSKKDYKKIVAKTPAISVLAVKKQDKDILSYLSKTKTKLIITHSDYTNLKPKETLSLNIDKKANNLYSICTDKPQNKSINIFI